jgi:hypothetical protein
MPVLDLWRRSFQLLGTIIEHYCLIGFGRPAAVSSIFLSNNADLLAFMVTFAFAFVLEEVET